MAAGRGSRGLSLQPSRVSVVSIRRRLLSAAASAAATSDAKVSTRVSFTAGNTHHHNDI